MQVRVGPLPEKRQLLEGCSGTVISCAAPTVIIFLLVPGDVTLPEAGPLLPAAATTVSPLSQAYSAASMSIRLCCLLSGFGTNGDIQDVNVKTGTVSDGPFNGTTDGFGGAVSFTIQNFQDDQMGPGSHAHIFPFR